MQTIKDTVTSTVKPVIESAIEKGAPVLTSAMETAISAVERIDPEAQQREAYFKSAQSEEESAIAAAGQQPDGAAAQQDGASDDVQPQASEEEKQEERGPLDRLKIVTEDLLDLWLFEGSKGLSYVKASKAYRLTDPYVNYVAKYEAVKSKTTDLQARLAELSQKVILFYDDATNFVGMLITVLQERQGDLVKYIKSTYSNVQVFAQDNYMRLDFNQDGSVSMEDMRANLLQFYEFLKSYDYLEASTRIKSTLYDQAVSMIRREQQEQSIEQEQAAAA